MALKLVKAVKKAPMQAEEQKSREEYLVACLKDELNDPRFSDWERGFIASLVRQVEQGRKPSRKQTEILERIWAK